MGAVAHGAVARKDSGLLAGGGSGGGSGGGGSIPPNIEEMLRRSQDRVKRFLPGGLGGGRAIALIAVGLLALWLMSGLYKVQPDEQGVELLFGKWDGVITESGLHWRWPAPIGEVQTPKVTVINRVNIGFQDSSDLGGRVSGTRRCTSRELNVDR